MASNYDDVLAQLKGAGLLVDSLEVGKLRRCKTEGDSERRGWYHLHEMRLANGDDLIVGIYGVWRGAENNATKVELRKTELSSEQRDSLRKRLAEDKRRSDQARKADADRAADKAAATWKRCVEGGDCDYLHRKKVQAHGVRFSPQGSMVIPMLDAAGRIHGLQVIRGAQPGRRKRLDKEYWPAGLVKKAHFHLIGMAGQIILVAEGYATAASLFEATGLCVAVAFDAGNLAAVASALHARYKQARILICADDDAFREGNPGVTLASAAAMEVGGAFVVPQFADAAARAAAFETDGKKLSDFNDLHVLEGLHVVRVQVENRITALGWRVAKTAAAKSVGEGGTPAIDPLRPIETTEELLERYAMVYGQGGAVFDHQEHSLVGLSDMRDACMSRAIHRAWMEHPERQMVRVTEVGFDPAETDKSIRCNLWGGWPTTPKAGSCETILDLARYMFGEQFDWVMRWLAYPIQHPGAKMKSALVIHGPQGVGKNLIFELVMLIYGVYGRAVDQNAIEDKFNDYSSRKLFLIFDEVVARSDLYHIKNKLKAFITSDYIRINPKNMAAYDERNHVNVVFLSNEAMPVVLEEDDRRHCVIWTPPKLSREFYREVQAEIDAGGVAALHHHLLSLDLGDFDNHTLPPMSAAKRELIDLGLDSPSRFVKAMEEGDINGFPSIGRPALLTPALTTDMFDLYQVWCTNTGLKALNLPRFSNALRRKHNAEIHKKRFDLGDGVVKGPCAVVYLPGGNELPPGANELDWTGSRIDVFRTALKDYKGQKYGN
ncbi:MAG: DUF5906 domain-containing protein [Rhodoferax sp.]|nr:DUF5906 domain-containing protein [Rhodoferax sp.]